MATLEQQIDAGRRRVDRVKRTARILELHHEGLSERAIAREVGTSRTTVWQTIQAAKR